MNTSLKVNSYSKINLGLNVINQRKDGYHNIQSIFIENSLHDTLEFIPSKSFSLKCDNNNLSIDSNNTIHTAYSIIHRQFSLKKHYTIILDKNIPLYSGLGGGSSNAATTIKTLNDLYNLKLTKEKMINLALLIGSDVPFFIRGGTKLVKGRGEIITDFESCFLNNLFFLLVFPKFKISTKWAYQNINIKKNLDGNIYSDKFSPLDAKVEWKFFNNDFEEVVGSAYPEIFEIKEFLYDNGALYSGLSGSGSTMFGIYNDKKLVEKIQHKFIKYNTKIVSPI